SSFPLVGRRALVDSLGCIAVAAEPEPSGDHALRRRGPPRRHGFRNEKAKNSLSSCGLRLDLGVLLCLSEARPLLVESSAPFANFGAGFLDLRFGDAPVNGLGNATLRKSSHTTSTWIGRRRPNPRIAVALRDAGGQPRCRISVGWPSGRHCSVRLDRG